MSFKVEEARELLAVGEKRTERMRALVLPTITSIEEATSWADDHAEFAARLIQHFSKDYGDEPSLALEWMLDHFVALRLEDHIMEWMHEIWQHLVSNKHDERHKFEYFNDAVAFFVRRERMAFICGKGHRYLVIDNSTDLQDYLAVRRVWPRTRRNCINNIDQPTLRFYRQRNFSLQYNHPIYGDARDPGHVLTYNRYRFGKSRSEHGKCDKVIWNLNEPLWFFFEINSLHTQLVAVGASGEAP